MVDPLAPNQLRLPPLSGALFDCDGVLLDSNGIKTKAFGDCLLAEGYDEKIAARFQVLQQANFGLSRYRLFDMFYTDLLGCPVDTRQRERLLEGFGKACRLGYSTVARTEGTTRLIPALAAMMPLYVVSGSDERELQDVLAEHGLAAHFRRICGSPTPKTENVAKIVSEIGAPSGSLWFFGDAKADYDAAAANGLGFVYVDRYGSDRDRMRALARERGFPMIDTLADVTWEG